MIERVVALVFAASSSALCPQHGMRLQQNARYFHSRCVGPIASADDDDLPPPSPPPTRYDSEDVDAASDAAEALRSCPRAEAGREAFEGTTWSTLMQMDEGGSTIFTMQLLEDDSCRFSDTDALGSWESQEDWVVIEKPKGFFDSTLFLSARLQPPTEDRPKWRLVEGVVQQSNSTSAAADEDGERQPVELKRIASFGANEFEEALLVDLPRFREDDLDDDLEEQEP
jgi:hypothetical protein